MNCLVCGQQNAFGEATCGGCGTSFPIFPPYARPNHVSQLQAAVRECLGGHLNLDQLGAVYAPFADLVMDYEGRWRVLEGPPLVERLDVETGRFRGCLADLDQSQALLVQAVEAIEQALDTGSADPLEPVSELLQGFYRRACDGCISLLKELEEPDSTSGSFLDVRGL